MTIHCATTSGNTQAPPSRADHLCVRQGESFTSWFIRVAWDNGLEPASLYRVVLPGAHPSGIRDYDRIACADLISDLAQHTGQPEADLWAGTFLHWAGRVFEEDEGGSSKLSWLPPPGTSDSKKSFGQQVCPACLQGDDTPYLRLHWRLAFVTTCLHHEVLLVDRCQHCAAPVRPDRGTHRPWSMTRCWRCGFDLRRSRCTHAPEPEPLAFQRELIEAAETGWALLDNQRPVHSLAYFRLLWIIYRLLASGSRGPALRGWLMARHAESFIPADIPRLWDVEMLNAHCRRGLLRLSEHLLEGWPDIFVDACRAVGLTSRVLFNVSTPMPFVYQDAVTEHLHVPRRHVCAAEMESVKSHMARRGITPTRPAIRRMLGVKVSPECARPVPANPTRRPHHTARFWKINGVSPEVRQASRRAALNAGENLGPWVDQILRRELSALSIL